MKLTEKEKQSLKDYIEIVKTLKGNPRYEKGLRNGVQNLIVEEKRNQLSKKGNPMIVVVWRNLESGAVGTSYYTTFKKKLHAKAEKISVNQMYQCIVSGAEGFLNVDPLLSIGEGSPFVIPPLATANVIGYDMEVFKHNWSVTFTDVLTDKDFTINDDVELLNKFLNKHNESVFVGYNNKGYDTHILKAIAQGKDPYPISKQIVDGDDNSKVYKMYVGSFLQLIEVDIMQDNRGFSLKEHGGFLGMEIKESDIDFDIDRALTEEEIQSNNYYNVNDVKITNARFIKLLGALKTKALVCQMYDMPYKALFMTNANLIAEILKAEFHEDRGDFFDAYEAPQWLRFDNVEVLKQVAYWVWNGQPLKKKKNKQGEWVTDLGFEIKLRDLTVDVGSGGLHGAIPNYIKKGIIKQSDVGSLYPNTSVNNGYVSRNIPEKYRHFYADILKARMEYKAKGDKDKEQAMKLLLNTYYGVLRAKFNKLYDRRQAIMINITGQMALLDLAEKIEPHAYISALNTDSINYEPFSDEDDKAIEAIKKEWCERTGYLLDTDIITDIAQANINNYVCRFDNGKIKKKGAVSMGGGIKINKAIVYDALSEYFMNGIEPEETIRKEQDLLKFQIISKTGWTYQQTRLYTDLENGKWNEIQKVNRSFAVKEGTDYKLGVIRKYKEPTEKEVVNEETLQTETVEVAEQIVKAIPNEPPRYTIANESISDCHVKREDIDEDYYINLAKLEIMAYQFDKETLKAKLGEDYEESEESAEEGY